MNTDSDSGIKFVNVGFKKLAQCYMNISLKYLVTFSAIFGEIYIILPSLYHKNLTEFSNTYVLPNLIVNKDFIFVNIEFIPFTLKLECFISRNNSNSKYYAYGILDKMDFPQVDYKETSNVSGICTNLPDIYLLSIYCRFDTLFIKMGDKIPPTDLAIDLQYIYLNTLVINSSIYFNYVYFDQQVTCYCNGSINLDPYYNTTTKNFNLVEKKYSILRVEIGLFILKWRYVSSITVQPKLFGWYTDD